MGQHRLSVALPKQPDLPTVRAVSPHLRAQHPDSLLLSFHSHLSKSSPGPQAAGEGPETHRGLIHLFLKCCLRATWGSGVSSAGGHRATDRMHKDHLLMDFLLNEETDCNETNRDGNYEKQYTRRGNGEFWSEGRGSVLRKVNWESHVWSKPRGDQGRASRYPGEELLR